MVVILLTDVNINSVVAEINGIVKGGTILTRLWNSKARFVVAGANEFSMSQQKDILDSFSKLRIYNCIIVSREHYIIGKEYSSRINVNNVDTGMNLVVYT